MASSSFRSPPPGRRGLKPALDLIKGRGGFHWKLLTRRSRMVSSSLVIPGLTRNPVSDQSWQTAWSFLDSRVRVGVRIIGNTMWQGQKKKASISKRRLTVQIKFYKLTQTTPAVCIGFQRSPLPVSVFARPSGVMPATIRKSRCRSNVKNVHLPPTLPLSHQG